MLPSIWDNGFSDGKPAKKSSTYRMLPRNQLDRICVALLVATNLPSEYKTKASTQNALSIRRKTASLAMSTL